MNNYFVKQGDKKKRDIFGRPHEYYEAVPVGRLGLSAHSEECLKKANILTAADIYDTGVVDLLMVRGLSTEDIIEILRQLERYFTE